MIKIVNKEDKKKLNLKEMQSMVGGYIERHPKKVEINGKSYDVIVNEEGIINGLPINKNMLDRFGITVCGNAILIEGGLY
mgnify:CR=1 FL=1|tara:strand:- start:471 stop:710 length:240 start_codon:yes stop_codon:yes gene_type:complete